VNATENSVPNAVFAATVPKSTPLKNFALSAPLLQVYIAPAVKVILRMYPFAKDVENAVWNVPKHSAKIVICVQIVL